MVVRMSNKNLRSRLGAAGITFSGMRAALIILTILCFFGLLYTNAIVPALNRHIPVIKDAYAVIDDETPTSITLRTFGRKAVDCLFVPGSLSAGVKINNFWERAEVSRLNPTAPRNNSRGSDKIVWGPHNIVHENMSQATDVKMVMQHLCNPNIKLTTDSDGTLSETLGGDLRIVTVGPFNIDDMRMNLIDSQ